MKQNTISTLVSLRLEFMRKSNCHMFINTLQSHGVELRFKMQFGMQWYQIVTFFLSTRITPARTHAISGLKSRILKLTILA